MTDPDWLIERADDYIVVQTSVGPEVCFKVSPEAARVQWEILCQRYGLTVEAFESEGGEADD